MLSSLSLPVLILIFVAAAAVVWIAGIQLSNATDIFSVRFGLGEALGGLLFLAIATNLPEIAITSTAALRQNIGIATGNILGGIAIQTVVLVVLDVFGVRGRRSLSYLAASLDLVLEGVLLIAILTVAVMGSQLPSSLIVGRVEPAGLLITVLWLAGIWLIGKARTGLPWHAEGHAPGGQTEPRGDAKAKKMHDAQNKGVSITRTAIVFIASAIVTLVAGVVLEMSGGDIAGRVGIDGVLFGSTFLAAATALPEVSTGLAAVKLGDYKLAVSDIFGGNAFLPVLFLLASLLSGQAALPQAKSTDIYLTGLGSLLTAIYLYGLIFRPRRRILRMGIDSLLVLILYAIGIVGLIAVAYR